MIEVKTAELSGKALAWATWLADRGEPGAHNPKTGYIWTDLDEHWSPHSDWSQGGPLIDKHNVEILRAGDCVMAKLYGLTNAASDGKTPLIAACRAIVQFELGDAVSVPAELVQQQGEGGGKV